VSEILGLQFSRFSIDQEQLPHSTSTNFPHRRQSGTENTFRWLPDYPWLARNWQVDCLPPTRPSHVGATTSTGLRAYLTFGQSFALLLKAYS